MGEWEQGQSGWGGGAPLCTSDCRARVTPQYLIHNLLKSTTMCVWCVGGEIHKEIQTKQFNCIKHEHH